MESPGTAGGSGGGHRLKGAAPRCHPHFWWVRDCPKVTRGRNGHPNPAAGEKRGKPLVFPSKEGSGRKTLFPSWNFLLIAVSAPLCCGAGSWRNTQSLSPPINNRFAKSTLHYFQQLPPLALMLSPAFLAHGKEQNNSSGWLIPPSTAKSWLLSTRMWPSKRGSMGCSSSSLMKWKYPSLGGCQDLPGFG